jgi:hypothetical protein
MVCTSLYKNDWYLEYSGQLPHKIKQRLKELVFIGCVEQFRPMQAGIRKNHQFPGFGSIVIGGLSSRGPWIGNVA